jgi:hypothetical protein
MVFKFVSYLEIVDGCHPRNVFLFSDEILCHAQSDLKNNRFIFFKHQYLIANSILGSCSAFAR